MKMAVYKSKVRINIMLLRNFNHFSTQNSNTIPFKLFPFSVGNRIDFSAISDDGKEMSKCVAYRKTFQLPDKSYS